VSNKAFLDLAIDDLVQFSKGLIDTKDHKLRREQRIAFNRKLGAVRSVFERSYPAIRVKPFKARRTTRQVYNDLVQEGWVNKNQFSTREQTLIASAEIEFQDFGWDRRIVPRWVKDVITAGGSLDDLKAAKRSWRTRRRWEAAVRLGAGSEDKPKQGQGF